MSPREAWKRGVHCLPPSLKGYKDLRPQKQLQAETSSLMQARGKGSSRLRVPRLPGPWHRPLESNRPAPESQILQGELWGPGPVTLLLG